MRYEKKEINIKSNSIMVAKTRFNDLYAGIGDIRLDFHKAFKEDGSFVVVSLIIRFCCSIFFTNYITSMNQVLLFFSPPII